MITNSSLQMIMIDEIMNIILRKVKEGDSQSNSLISYFDLSSLRYVSKYQDE